MDYQFVCALCIFALALVVRLHTTDAIVGRDVVLTPKKDLQLRGKSIFYEEDSNTKTTQNQTILRPWERTLKHVTFVTLFTNAAADAATGNISKLKAYDDFLHTPYIPQREQSDTRFGDIVTLASGRLEQTRNNTFRFVEGICAGYDCEAERVWALWQVQKIRHRDTTRKYRYEMKFSVSPLRAESLSSNLNHKRKAELESHKENNNNKRSVLQTYIQRDDDYPHTFGKIITNNNNDARFAERRFDLFGGGGSNYQQTTTPYLDDQYRQATPIPQSTFMHGIFQPHPHQQHQHFPPLPEKLNIGEYIRDYTPKATPKIEHFPHILNAVNRNYYPTPTTYRPIPQIKIPRPELYPPPTSQHAATMKFPNSQEVGVGGGVNKIATPVVTHHFHHHFYMPTTTSIENGLGGAEQPLNKPTHAYKSATTEATGPQYFGSYYNERVKASSPTQHASPQTPKTAQYHVTETEVHREQPTHAYKGATTESTGPQYFGSYYNERVKASLPTQHGSAQTPQTAQYHVTETEAHREPPTHAYKSATTEATGPQYYGSFYNERVKASLPTQHTSAQTPKTAQYHVTETEVHREQLVHVTSVPPLQRPLIYQMYEIPVDSKVPLLIYPAPLVEEEESTASNNNKPFVQSERMSEEHIRYSEPDPLYLNLAHNPPIELQSHEQAAPQLEPPKLSRYAYYAGARKDAAMSRKSTRPNSIEAQLPPPDDDQDVTIPYEDETQETTKPKHDLEQKTSQKDLHITTTKKKHKTQKVRTSTAAPSTTSSSSGSTTELEYEDTTSSLPDTTTSNPTTTTELESTNNQLETIKTAASSVPTSTTPTTYSLRSATTAMPSTTALAADTLTSKSDSKLNFISTSTAMPTSLRSLGRYRLKHVRLVTTTTTTTEQPAHKWKPRRKHSSNSAERAHKVEEHTTQMPTTTTTSPTTTTIETTTTTQTTTTKATPTTTPASTNNSKAKHNLKAILKHKRHEKHLVPTVTTNPPAVGNDSLLLAPNATENFEVITQKSVSKSVSVKIGENGKEIPVILDDSDYGENEVEMHE